MLPVSTTDTITSPPDLDPSERNNDLPNASPGTIAMIDQSNRSTTTVGNRFPAFGTREFNHTCRWTLQNRRDVPMTTYNCTILARPSDGNNEGISSWIAQIVSGYVMAKQTGCSFLIDYNAPGVTISEFLVPPAGATIDWRIPPGFTTCLDTANCYIARSAYSRGGGPQFRTSHKNLFLAAVPNYRTPYGSFGSETIFQQDNRYKGLGKIFGDGGFDIETSMACALGSLLQLSPTGAVNYQPNLFTTILSTLQDPNNALVLAVYIRTGHTEHIHIEERIERYRKQAEPIIECALHLEKELITTKHSTGPKVVWMVVTDSQDLKTWITESYSTNNENDSSRQQRTILTTQSRGAHTKTRNNEPSTADFAEAFLDWYLIGESDAVVADHTAPSFGDTATFRTARPYYKVPKEGGRCSKVEPTYKW